MKVIYKIGFLASLFSLQVQGGENQCSQVQFESSNDHYHYQVLANNVGNIKQYKKSSEFFHPGQHTVTIFKWLAKDWANYSRTHTLNKLNRIETLHTTTRALSWNEPQAIDLFMNIEGGRLYTLNGVGNGNKIEIKSVEKLSCNLKGDKLAIAGSPTINDIQLPNELLYRLDKAMAELKKENRDTKINFVPFTSVMYFGAITGAYDKPTKIVAVTPNSQAAALGLRAGDELLKLGNRYLPDTDLESNFIFKYLKTLEINDSLNVLIKRDGREIALSGIYIPEIIPEFIYTFSNENLAKQTLVQHVAIGTDMSVKLSKLIIEINQYILKHGIDRKNIVISRKKHSDIKFGMSGNFDNNDSYPAFIVEQIDKNSPASRIGLEPGDKIIQLNDIGFQGDVRSLSNKLNQLKNNEVFTFLVKRENSEILLTSKLARNVLPEYKFTINFSSKERAIKLFKKYKEFKIWKERKDEVEKSRKFRPDAVPLPVWE